MTPEEMYGQLKPAQEAKGYRFNPDQTWVLEVLSGILANQMRYGYGFCPGRLATGQIESDGKVICPCVFREEDLARYDRCYCHLYVSPAVAEGHRKAPEIIPERWLQR